MKGLLKFGGHFLASLFLFHIIGMACSLLLIQNKWLDMRFDSEYLIFVMMAAGVWFFFVSLFMNAKQFMIWKRPFFSKIILPLSALIVVLITFINKSFLLMPAYVTRKGLFLDDVLTIGQMNAVLLVWIVVGILAWYSAAKYPLDFKKSSPHMEWTSFSLSARFGISLFFIATAILIFVYLGQSEIQESANRAAASLMEADVEAFRDYLLTFGPLAAVISGLLMIFQSVIAPLPAFVITFANGLLFGWFWGAVLSWSSAMAGAVLCFFIAKFFGRPVVEKLVSKRALSWWDGFFEKYGRHAIFIARLVPIVSFDLVSYAAGVTAINFWHFFWATGLGQLPATILYSYLGETASGSVQILFFVFTVVIAIAVIGSIIGPKLLGEKRRKA